MFIKNVFLLKNLIDNNSLKTEKVFIHNTNCWWLCMNQLKKKY